MARWLFALTVCGGISGCKAEDTNPEPIGASSLPITGADSAATGGETETDGTAGAGSDTGSDTGGSADGTAGSTATDTGTDDQGGSAGPTAGGTTFDPDKN